MKRLNRKTIQYLHPECGPNNDNTHLQACYVTDLIPQTTSTDRAEANLLYNIYYLLAMVTYFYVNVYKDTCYYYKSIWFKI